MSSEPFVVSFTPRDPAEERLSGRRSRRRRNRSDRAKSEMSRYYQSSRWARIRQRVLNRDDGRCWMCGGSGNQVHHMSYSDVVLSGADDAYLVTLCSTCHHSAHVSWDGRQFSHHRARKHVAKHVPWLSMRKRSVIVNRREYARHCPATSSLSPDD